jgi:ABC-2 type transport system ATP-binding protein
MEGALDRLKADLAPEIEVRTDDVTRAIALAKARGFDPSPTDDGLVARFKPGEDTRDAAALLNRALVEADIAVFAIGPRARSLEGIYRDVSAPPPPAASLSQPEFA